MFALMSRIVLGGILERVGIHSGTDRLLRIYPVLQPSRTMAHLYAPGVRVCFGS